MAARLSSRTERHDPERRRDDDARSLTNSLGEVVNVIVSLLRGGNKTLRQPQALAKKLDEYGVVRELGVVQPIARLDGTEVYDGDPKRSQFLCIGIIADTGLLSGNEARKPQGLVIGGEQHGKRPVGLSVAHHLLLEDIDIDIR